MHADAYGPLVVVGLVRVGWNMHMGLHKLQSHDIVCACPPVCTPCCRAQRGL